MESKDMDTREELRPYKKQRLGFEGVLIDIIYPNRRNGYLYGLVFGSIYAPNEKIEVDHAVIQMDQLSFKKAGLELFNRYYFTAVVKSYFKLTNILGVMAERENFMLAEINLNKLKEFPVSYIEQPTMFVQNRINSIMMCKGDNPFTKEWLMEQVLRLPNDGSVEEFIDDCSRRNQQSHVGRHDMINILYA